MTLRIALIALALAAAGCNQQSSTENAAGDAPQLDAPAPDSEPSRVYAAANDAARAVSNELTVSVTQELPDAADADIQERLLLRGGNGLNVSAAVTGAISPATQVGGQTLRALLAIPVEEPQVLVYRVTEAAGSPGLCSQGTPSHVVVWEPSAPGEGTMKLLGVTGGAPGAGRLARLPDAGIPALVGSAMRYKLTIEYDGRTFQGWQRLANAPSVQGALEDAVEKLTGVRSEVIGAGRTDAGVHAAGQVAHVDIEKPLDAWKLAEALNAHLRPHPIAVLKTEEAQPEFHARFDAVQRSYRYTIVNRRAPLTMERGLAWRVGPQLDFVAMELAANHLVGHHDFTTFRDSLCQAKSPIKTLDEVDFDRSEDTIAIWFHARSFLHRQVRSMVGTLVDVGLGKISASDLADALAAKDRARCGPVAPPDGLCLMRVDYAK